MQQLTHILIHSYREAREPNKRGRKRKGEREEGERGEGEGESEEGKGRRGEEKRVNTFTSKGISHIYVTIGCLFIFFYSVAYLDYCLHLLDSHSNSVPQSSGAHMKRKGEVGGGKGGREDGCLLKVLSIAP